MASSPRALFSRPAGQRFNVPETTGAFKIALRAHASPRDVAPVSPPFDGEGGDVWDALTNIFADMDSQGGVEGPEGEALQETLASLRGLLDMHLQLRKKAVELTARRMEVARERDAALERLASSAAPSRNPFARLRAREALAPSRDAAQ